VEAELTRLLAYTCQPELGVCTCCASEQSYFNDRAGRVSDLSTEETRLICGLVDGWQGVYCIRQLQSFVVGKGMHAPTLGNALCRRCVRDTI